MKIDTKTLRAFFKAFLFSFLLLLLIFFVVGGVLSDDYSISATYTVKAPRTEVYNQVMDLKSWPEWNPFFFSWNADSFYGGKNMQNLPFIKWQGDEAGMGRIDVQSTQAPSQIQTDLRVYQPAVITSFGSWNFTESDEDSAAQTQVTWTYEGQAQGVVTKWYLLFTRSSMSRDLLEGLQHLETYMLSPSS